MRLAEKVVLVGWDAADWRVIQPLLAQGQMPALAGLLEQGAWGNLAALAPTLSPLLWTSIATGKRPHQHGILSAVEPDPRPPRGADDCGLRLCRSTSRTCKALWNLLTQRGHRTHVVNFPASHPAEPIGGVCVSNRFARATAPHGRPWPVPAGAVHPVALEPTLAELRVHPGELPAAALLPLVPQAAQVDQGHDPRLAGLAAVLAQDATVQAVATWIMEHEEWDLLAVCYQGLETACHQFMRYCPPRLEQVDGRDFAFYQQVAPGVYCFYDMMLDRLRQLAGAGATLLVVSDHGFHSDHLRPRPGRKGGDAAVAWHRPVGIGVLAGPGVQRGARLYGASVLDVTPTVLTLLGEAVGADMEGRPWVEAMTPRPEVDRVVSWELIDGPDGRHAGPEPAEQAESEQAIGQLVALGYVEPPAPAREHNVQAARRLGRFNLAQALLDGRRPGEARAVAAELVEQCPADLRYQYLLGRCEYHLGNLEACRRLLAPHLDGQPGAAAAHLLMAQVELAGRRFEAALQHAQCAGAGNPDRPGLRTLLGQVYGRLRRWAEAERAFREALAADPDHAEAWHGLAVAGWRQQRYEEALEAALRAVGLRHEFPMAHFHLGVILARLGRRGPALAALEVCLGQHPGLVQAHRWLARLYEAEGDAEQARRHQLRVIELGAAARGGWPTPMQHTRSPGTTARSL